MSKSTKSLYIVEMTDTYGGEANYCWVKRFLVKASSPRGAIRIVTNETGDSVELSMLGEVTAYDSKLGCIRYFVEETDKESMLEYNYSFKDLTK